MELVPCSVAQIQKQRRVNPEVPVALGSTWTTTTTTLDDLCNSLLIEIISRLPLRQLKQCQVVFKRWHDVISDPFFIRLFGEKYKNFAFLLNYIEGRVEGNMVLKVHVISNEPDDFKSEGFSLSFLPCCQSWLQDSATVQASCNDLLLCSDWRRRFYYVCNPFTLDWVQLPPNPPSPTQGLGGVGFICDCSSYYSDAAGANSSSSSSSACRYTVLRLIERLPHDDGSNECKIKVQIYSSDVGEWKENVVSCGQRDYVSPAHRANAVHYNGLLFFLNNGHGLMGLDPYEDGQLRHFIPVPRECFDYHFRCFGICKGTMRLFQIADYPVSFIRVWDLKDYEKGEWTMEKQVYLRDMISDSCGWVIEAANTQDFLPFVVAFDPNDGDMVYFLADHGNVFKIVSCNMRMKTLEEICDLPFTSFIAFEVITYMPSWCPAAISLPNQRMP